MTDAVAFSGSQIVVVTGLLSCVSTLFWLLLKEKDARIGDLKHDNEIKRQEIEAWRQTAFDSTHIASDAVGVVKTRGAR